ncbi:hypothetical protein BSPWISOX_880 [uncultured Gammaproteobacteria bacterium]|nr:hypothetical protein BSPWISOX_880 [uncultured Gammaproteobacteria bacterium]VVM21807.1 hypothetical protein BSPWISOXPB_8888 [uncultured Gammaproteobacteria bacterium]
MTRLLISVEGKSEWKFVEQVLQPHFANLEVYIKLHNMKGNISIDRVSGKLNRLIHNFDFVTTLYDFYGFKRLSDNETKKTLEDKIKNGIKQGQQHKIIPYVQMYEFEALLFSDSVKMASGLKTNQGWIDEVVNDFSDLETINNSKETAPSKRIENNATYIKTQHAPIILQEIGLPKIREKCRGFNAWLAQLENLPK